MACASCTSDQVTEVDGRRGTMFDIDHMLPFTCR
jgi:hypothetical protein